MATGCNLYATAGQAALAPIYRGGGGKARMSIYYKVRIKIPAEKTQLSQLDS
jgi:hypothetical protein